MRSFNPYEKEIIKKLTESRKGIPGLISENFINNSRLMIYFLPDGSVRYEFKSDNYDFLTAIDELAKLVKLLEYLKDENLIRVVFPATTSLNNFDNPEHWSIGNSLSTDTQVKVLNKSETAIPNFFRDHRDNSFEATQDLKILVKNNFENWDQLKHRQVIKATVIGIIITFIGSVLVPLGVSYWEFERNYDKLNDQIEILENGIRGVKKQNQKDSTQINDRQKEDLKKYRDLKNQIDSIKNVLRKNTIKKKSN